MDSEVEYWVEFFCNLYDVRLREEAEVKLLRLQIDEDPRKELLTECQRRGIDVTKTPVDELIKIIGGASSVGRKLQMEWKDYTNDLWERSVDWRERARVSEGENAFFEVVKRLTLNQLFTNGIWNSCFASRSSSLQAVCKDKYRILVDQEEQRRDRDRWQKTKKSKKRMMAELFPSEKERERVRQVIRDHVIGLAKAARRRMRDFLADRHSLEQDKLVEEFEKRVLADIQTLDDDDGLVVQDDSAWLTLYDERIAADYRSWIELVDDAEDAGSLLSRLTEACQKLMERIERSREENEELAQDEQAKTAFEQFHLTSFLANWHFCLGRRIRELRSLSEAARALGNEALDIHDEMARKFTTEKTEAAMIVKDWYTQRWEKAVSLDAFIRYLSLIHAAMQVLDPTKKKSIPADWKDRLKALATNRVEDENEVNTRSLIKDDEEKRKEHCTQLASQQKAVFRNELRQLQFEASKLHTSSSSSSSSLISSVTVVKHGCNNFFLSTPVPSDLTPAPHLRDLVKKGSSVYERIDASEHAQQWLVEQPIKSIKALLNRPAANAQDYWMAMPFVTQLVAQLELMQTGP